MARHPGHLRGVVVAREVDIILDEHSEVFSTVQECRPAEKNVTWESVSTETKGVSGPMGAGFWLLAWVIVMSEEKYNLVGKTF